MSYLFLAICAVLVVVPLFFVSHRVYKDGIAGRAGLLGIAFAAATFLLESLAGTEYEMLPQTVLLSGSFAVFLIWHLFRFHRRVICGKQ